MFEKLYTVAHLFVLPIMVVSVTGMSTFFWHSSGPVGGWVVFKILRNIEYKITHYYHLTAIIKQLLSLKVFKNKPRG